MTGGLDGFLLEVVIFSERKKEKPGIRKTRSDTSPGLSVPPKARGAAPDVGSEIQNFLLVSRAVRVLSGRASGFHLTTLKLYLHMFSLG